MDAKPDILAETVRAKRTAVDNDLELIRVRVRRADPRQGDARRWASRVLPALAAAAGLWLWIRRRRSVQSLEDLMVHGLNELYAGERDLVPALERMAGQASNPELQKAFETHRVETEAHIGRLHRVFRAIGAKPSRRAVETGVASVILEGERLLKRRVDPDVRDAWLIATAQRIEHLEIATYGTVRTYAQTLGFIHAADLLQQSLDEEKATDEKLTNLAERFVNPQSIRTV